MSAAIRSRWIDWKPKACIFADPAETEPTKPSKPGFVGFVGATLAESPKIEAARERSAHASGVLNRAGVRIMRLDGAATIGVWSDLDGPEIRAALRIVGPGQLSVRYLDGAGIPMKYKLRRVEGEPVPMGVLAEMERRPAEHWKVRDQMLKEMAWCSKGSWADWKGSALNRRFREQGGIGQAFQSAGKEIDNAAKAT
jgi:hypothetical protein